MKDSSKTKTTVDLMNEALSAYKAIESRIKTMPPPFHFRLERAKKEAWSRYLRRWAAACDDGYQGDWFEPLFAQQVGK